jgi:hypothetical protein
VRAPNKKAASAPKSPALFGIGNPKKFMIYGVEIGGWGALLALAISLGTLAWTAYDTWLAHPTPELWAPEEINIACHDKNSDGCSNNDNLYMRANPVTFINRTGGNHPYTVRTMDAHIQFIGPNNVPVGDLCLDWQYLSNISTAGSERASAGPVEVLNDRPFSHEIEYFPRRRFHNGAIDRKNFMPFRKMESLIASKAVNAIHITLEASIVGRETALTASCSVPVDEDMAANAIGHSFALYARECFPLETNIPPSCLSNSR